MVAKHKVRKKTSISVDKALWERFERKVASEGRGVSAVIEELIASYLVDEILSDVPAEEVPLVVEPVRPLSATEAGEEVWRMREESFI